MSALRARQASIAAVIAVLLAVLLLGFGAAAATEPTISDDPATAVAPPQRPTEVTIAAYLIGLIRAWPSRPKAAPPWSSRRRRPPRS
jgi:hypothetical protein